MIDPDQFSSPIESGNWPTAVWTLHETTIEPPAELVSAAFCLCYQPDTNKVMLMSTLRDGNESWGITGGHVGDTPFDDETPRQGAAREAEEEGGCVVKPEELQLFAVRRIENISSDPNARRDYGQLSYISYYLTHVIRPLVPVTGEEVISSGYFSEQDAEAMVSSDKTIIRLGYTAIRRSSI